IIRRIGEQTLYFLSIFGLPGDHPGFAQRQPGEIRIHIGKPTGLKFFRAGNVHVWKTCRRLEDECQRVAVPAQVKRAIVYISWIKHLWLSAVDRYGKYALACMICFSSVDLLPVMRP